MEENIQHIARQIQDKLREQPLLASRDLLDFVETYSLTPERQSEAVMLNWRINRTNEPGENEQLFKEADQLLRTIVEEYAPDAIAQKRRQRDQQLAFLQQQFAKDPVPNAVVCQTKNLGKTFRGRGDSPDFKLRDVSLELRQGAITGVVGENGNGKTTLFRLIVGELRADEGVLSFPALDVKKDHPDWYKVKQKIAYVPQELPPWHGALRDNLHYEAAIHGVKGQKNEGAVDYIVQRLGLRPHIDKQWRDLSGGYKVRFALARALVWRPQLLVIDEPLANLDVKAQLVILNDLRNMANSIRFPLSILISSQHLYEIQQVSDNLLFLKKGEVKFYGPVSRIGEDRTYNMFELETPLDIGALTEKLKTFNYQRIDHDGLVFNITTPLTIGYQEFLSVLLAENIPIRYFRDISRSAKKLIL
jgi:ABC-type multidrug transport system ATPase subunit